MPRRRKNPKDGEGETSEPGQHHQVSSTQDVRTQDVRAQQQGFQQPERLYGQPQQGGVGRGGYPQQGRGGYPQQGGGGRGGYGGGGRGGAPPQQGRGGQGYQGQGPPPQGFMQGGPPPYQQQGRGGEPSSMAGGSGYGRGRGRGRGGRGGGPGPYGSAPTPHTGPSGPFPDLPQAAQQPYQQEQAATAPTQSFAPQFLLPVESGSSSPQSGSEAGVGPIVEKLEQVSLQAPPGPDVPGPSQIVVAGTTPLSSKGVRFPLRPGMGKTGTRCIVKANHFFAQLPDKDLHQYDVSITPEVTSRGVNRAVMEQLVKQYQETHLGRRLPAYDGRKSLYTAGPLPFASREFTINLLDEEDGLGGQRRERQFKVVIKFAAHADLHHLGQFLSGKQADAPQEALQVLDIVLRELPTHRYSPVGRSFYSPNLGRRQQLGEGLESWRGFYQSIRPTQMGLSLNIDMSSTAFIEPLNVIDFVAQLLNRDMGSRPLSDADRIKIKKALRGVKVEVTHRANMRRKYRISGLTSQPTRELTFPVDDKGTMKSVVEYFQETYGFTIQHTSLPCLQVGNQQRPNYLPMEVCKIVEGQRYSKRLNERQITALLKVTCQRPKDREMDILQTVYHNAYHEDPYAKEFGLKISDKLASVEARILPAPWLKYHETGREKDCLPHVGQWNMMNKKMVNGGTVNHWACVNFSRGVQDSVAHGFCQELAQMCQVSGMNFNPQPVIPILQSRL